MDVTIANAGVQPIRFVSSEHDRRAAPKQVADEANHLTSSRKKPKDRNGSFTLRQGQTASASNDPLSNVVSSVDFITKSDTRSYGIHSRSNTKPLGEKVGCSRIIWALKVTTEPVTVAGGASCENSSGLF